MKRFKMTQVNFFTRGPGTRMVTFVLFTCFNYYWSQEGQLCDMKVKSTCSCVFLRSFYEHIVQPDALSLQRGFAQREQVIEGYQIMKMLF